jgi:SAM-dependent methyltransferase
MEPAMELKSIDTLHRTKTGKISDKWNSYLTYYDHLFAPLRHKPISLLEIGVQNGGSQETWAEYFSEARLLVGCDIDPRCEALRYDDPRIKIVVGDANGQTAFQQITALSTSFDIIIDDGSHMSHDILRSFVNYFPLLKPGGVFVVEDTCCLYMNAFGGGLLNELSAQAFFKRLTDVLNFQFWKDEASIGTYLRTYFDLRSTPRFILEGWIESIVFRNSIITVRKSLAATHEKLGDRIIVGNVAAVQDWGGKRPGSI